LGRPVDPKTRANLLQRIIDRLAVSGLGGVTLRGVAKALDVTPPGLLHHFGSKTGMITAVIDELEREQMEVIEQVSAEGFSLEHFVRDLWAVQSSERELARIRLQLEAVTLDATETGLPGPVRARVMAVWVEAIARNLEAQGYDRATARNNATLVHAAFVGLLMDLLATGERERLDAACEELARIGRTIDRQAPGAGPAGPRAAAV
jgi:AcrR family transcriptional regulator